MAGQKKSLYEILGVTRDANSLDIGLGYQRRLSELQRAVPQDPSAMSLVKQAHEVLANPQRRAAYDASLVTQAEKAAVALQAGPPDLELEEGDEGKVPRNKFLIPGIALGAVILIALFFAMRSGKDPAPAPKNTVVEAPKPPPPPPPPKPLSAAQILAASNNSIGRVMSYEMSGRAVPIGLAVATEPGSMVTTCHGIPGGSQIVVRVGAESLSANLTITDEVLDLCMLSVAGLNAKPIALASEEARAGDKVYALGANAKGEFALTEGTVKQFRSVPTGKVVEVSMPIAANGSGGAVFDTYGRLLGIATTPHHFGAGIQAAIPASWMSQMRSRTHVK